MTWGTFCDFCVAVQRLDKSDVHGRGWRILSCAELGLVLLGAFCVVAELL